MTRLGLLAGLSAVQLVAAMREPPGGTIPLGEPLKIGGPHPFDVRVDLARPGSERTTLTLLDAQKRILQHITHGPAKPTKRHARKLKAGRPLWRA